MGVGRFAFTPILPMMALPVADAAWLATSNYVGYLAGALSGLVLRWTPLAGIRAGLAVVALGTLGMALASTFAWALVLRFLAGLASAWVLVNVSALGSQRPDVVFSGVGVGIAVAGLLCLSLMLGGSGAREAWVALGLLATAACFDLWNTHADGASPESVAPFRWTAHAGLLVGCYGAFGFGYIVPATFLPAMAKASIPSPVLFGLAWPIFGAAAAASTLFAGAARRRWGDRRVWIASHLVMAAGVGILLVPGIAAGIAMTVSAVLVGGTFMVATMAGFQEARRIGGAGARTLIAAMTAAFAAGQIAGPVVVSLLGNMNLALAAAVALLAASAVILGRIP